jgi:hypothetical protein
MRRRAVSLLLTMGAAVLLASGVALAQTVPEAKPDAAPQTGAPAGEVVPGE